MPRLKASRLRPLRHDQRPGDQGCGLARPAGLDRQGAKVDVAARQHDFLAGGRRNRLRLHGHDGLQQRQQVQRLAPAAGRFRLAQEGQGLADLTQLAGLPVHAPGDPLHRAEQVDQHGHAVGTSVLAHHVLEQHRRPALGHQAGLDFRHLQHGGNRRLDAHQAARGFQAVEDEIAQRGERHAASRNKRTSVAGTYPQPPRRQSEKAGLGPSGRPPPFGCHGRQRGIPSDPPVLRP